MVLSSTGMSKKGRIRSVEIMAALFTRPRGAVHQSAGP